MSSVGKNMIGFLWARSPASKRAMAGQIGGTPLFKVYQLQRIMRMRDGATRWGSVDWPRFSMGDALCLPASSFMSGQTAERSTKRHQWATARVHAGGVVFLY
jgi:hypothetical protein